jgi:hypothetical protein
MHAVSDTRGINKVARDDTTKKQIASDFDSNACRQSEKLLEKGARNYYRFIASF